MDKELRKAAKAAALQMKLHPKVADAIVTSLFKQMKEVLQSGDVDNPETIQNFRIINFGIFYSTQEKIKSKRDALRKFKNARI